MNSIRQMWNSAEEVTRENERERKGGESREESRTRVATNLSNNEDQVELESYNCKKNRLNTDGDTFIL